MKIKFQRSGGFAGLSVNVEMDSANLTEDKSTTFQDLLGKIFPFEQPEKANKGTDLYNYVLSVEEDGKEQLLEVDDACATDDMYAMFDFLMQENQKE